MRDRRFTSIFVGTVGLCLLLYLIVFNVREDQVAVHLRFDKPIAVIIPRLPVAPDGTEAPVTETQTADGVPVIHHAGWRLKLPWPLDKVRKFDQRIQYLDVTGVQKHLHDDQQIVPLVYASWRVTDPLALLHSFHGGDTEVMQEKLEDRLRDAVSSEVGPVFSGYTLDQILNTEESKLQFDKIERQLLDRVRNQLKNKNYGVQIQTVGITWIAMPEGQPTEAIYKRMSADQDRKATELRAAGNTQKFLITQQAVADGQMLVNAAESKAKQMIAEAERKTLEQYKTFAADPELAIFLRRLDAFKTIARRALDNEMPLTILVTTLTEPFKVLRLGAMGTDEGAMPELPAVLDAADGAAPEVE